MAIHNQGMFTRMLRLAAGLSIVVMLGATVPALAGPVPPAAPKPIVRKAAVRKPGVRRHWFRPARRAAVVPGHGAVPAAGAHVVHGAAPVARAHAARGGVRAVGHAGSIAAPVARAQPMPGVAPVVKPRVVRRPVRHVPTVAQDGRYGITIPASTPILDATDGAVIKHVPKGTIIPHIISEHDGLFEYVRHTNMHGWVPVADVRIASGAPPIMKETAEPPPATPGVAGPLPVVSAMARRATPAPMPHSLLSMTPPRPAMAPVHPVAKGHATVAVAPPHLPTPVVVATKTPVISAAPAQTVALLHPTTVGTRVRPIAPKPKQAPVAAAEITDHHWGTSTAAIAAILTYPTRGAKVIKTVPAGTHIPNIIGAQNGFYEFIGVTHKTAWIAVADVQLGEGKFVETPGAEGEARPK